MKTILPKFPSDLFEKCFPAGSRDSNDDLCCACFKPYTEKNLREGVKVAHYYRPDGKKFVFIFGMCMKCTVKCANSKKYAQAAANRLERYLIKTGHLPWLTTK